MANYYYLILSRNIFLKPQKIEGLPLNYVSHDEKKRGNKKKGSWGSDKWIHKKFELNNARQKIKL